MPLPVFCFLSLANINKKIKSKFFLSVSGNEPTALTLQSIKTMKQKKPKKQDLPHGKGGKLDFDPELMRMYLMGATNPGFSNKISSSDDIIDLHLNKGDVGGNFKIPPGDALFIQLEKFENALDRAIAAGKLEFRAIHGYGSGKLMKEIHKILDKHPHVRSYDNGYHSQYGYGSTLIYLQ